MEKHAVIEELISTNLSEEASSEPLEDELDTDRKGPSGTSSKDEAAGCKPKCHILTGKCPLSKHAWKEKEKVH